MAICGNGIWIQNQPTGSNLTIILDKCVIGNIDFIAYAAGWWNADGTLNDNWNNGKTNVINAVNTVYSYNISHPTNKPIKILGFIMYGRGEYQDISNYTSRISALVKLCNDTGLDGIADDIEEFASNVTAQTQINFYNNATIALHAMNPSRIMTYSRSVGNSQAPYFDQIVYPALKVDLLIPMFYDYYNNFSDYSSLFDWVLTNIQSPVSAGIMQGAYGMSTITGTIDQWRSTKTYTNLVGFSIWALDSGNSSMSSSDWNLWNAWTGKNFIGCNSSLLCNIPTCNLIVNF